jgi:hypothetical protein
MIISLHIFHSLTAVRINQEVAGCMQTLQADHVNAVVRAANEVNAQSQQLNFLRQVGAATHCSVVFAFAHVL